MRKLVYTFIVFLVISNIASKLYGQYCTNTYSNTADEWITNVTFNTINNSTGIEATNSYGNYTGISTNVNAGSAYTISVTFSSSIYSEYVKVWFDWDQDQVFEASEAYEVGNGISASVSTLITVPTGSVNGATRMRVNMKFAGYCIDPCEAATYGEVEDYTINISGGSGSIGCPTVGFYRNFDHASLASISPVTCGDAFWITGFDSIDAGGYVKPGWSIIIDQTDIWSDSENSLEIFGDGVSIGGFGPSDIFSPNFYGGQVDEEVIWTVYADGFDPNTFWTLEWCDAFPDGVFPYTIYDNSDFSTPITSGIFDHDGGTSCFQVNIGNLYGVATFTGPGIYDTQDGWAVFDAATAGPGTHTIEYCWDNEHGCSSCATQTITVVGPSADAGPDVAICNGSSTALEATGIGGTGALTYTYAWSPATGLSSTTVDDPIANPTTTTTYTVTVTDADGAGCTATSSVTVTVYNNPSGSITPDPAETCAGVSLSLDGNATPGTGSITSHSWSGSTGPLSASNVENPSFLTSTPGNYNLTYTVTDNYGCIGTDNISVAVYQNPSPTVTPDPANVCSGSNLTLDGGPAGGSAPYMAHSWSGDTSPLSVTNAQNPTFLSSTSGNYNLTYTVTDNNGCIGSDDITVSVKANPTATIAPDPAEVCANSNLGLSGNPSGGSGSYTTHLWTGNTGPLSSTITGTPVFNSAASGTFNLTYTVTDNAGCSGSDGILVTVNDKPNPQITPDPAEVCAGNNLTLNGNPSGGGGAYTAHSWTGDVGALSSTSIVDPVFSSVSPATYNLTYSVTDNNGCIGSDVIAVTVNDIDDASFTYPSSTFCQTGADPLPTITTPGGTFSASPAGLVLDTNTGEIDLSNSDIGTLFTVTYTTNGVCPESSSVSISITLAPDAEFTYSDPFCQGGTNPTPNHITGSDGTYSLTASSAVGLVFVNANTGVINLTASQPGFYEVQNNITATGCASSTQTQNVTILSAPAATISPDPAEVCANTNLTINGNPVAGNGTIASHLWTGNTGPLANSNVVATIFNASVSGAYNLTYTVTDDNGCTGTDNITVTVFSNPTTVITPDPAMVCAGVDQALNGNPTAGMGTIISHAWTGNTSPLDVVDISTPVFNASTGGDYNLTYTVTDDNGCVGIDAITVTAYDIPSVEITPDPAAVCAGKDLILDGNPVDGSSAIVSHVWTGDFGPLSATNISSPTFNAGASGSYNLTYTVNDNNGCTAADNISVTVYENPSASITPDPAEVCVGTDLQINTNPAGGSGTYTLHAWTGDIGSLSSIIISNPVFNNNIPGNYNLSYSVTDDNGCKATDLITVIVNDNPTVGITPDPAEVCAGINITLSGNPSGTSGLITTHLWSGDTSYVGVTYNQSTIFNHNVPGDYTLIYDVLDDNGCVASDTITVTVNSNPSASISQNPVIVCAGTDMTFDGNPSGGSGVYTHLWQGDVSELSATNVQSPIFNGSFGSYYFTYMVTDDNGCINSDTALVSVKMNPQLIMGVDSSNCNSPDGKAFVNVSGVPGPYIYDWNSQVHNSPLSTDTLLNLSAGTYYVTVTDNNGCSSIGTASFSDIGAAEVKASIINKIKCFGELGTITADMPGGQLPFTYYWINAGDTISNNDTLFDVPAGTYTIVIVDDNTCADPDVVILTEPDAIISTTVSTDVSCNGLDDGTADVTASGGSGTLSYLWSDISNTTTSTVASLSSMTYYVTITDDSLCTHIDSVEILELSGVNASITGSSDVTCTGSSNGTATVTGFGGTNTYTYLWNDPGATASATVTGLAPGVFSVTVSDGNGCTASQNVTISEPTALILTSSSDPAYCGGSSGMVSVSVSGGTPSYSYLWDATTGAQTADTATNLAGSDYSVTVTDENLCTASLTVTVDNIPGGQITIQVDSNVSCFGLANGSLSAIPVGGTAPYEFDWSPNGFTGDSTASYSDLPANGYTVTLTDANGCTVKATEYITQPLDLFVYENVSDVTCGGWSNGSVSIQVYEGTTPYTFLWSTGGTGSIITTLPGDSTYYVTITDANGCSKMTSYWVEEETPLEAEISLYTDPLCAGDNTGTATVEVTGGIPPYIYAWSASADNQISPTATDLPNAYFEVNVTDSVNCPATANVTLVDPPRLVFIDSLIIITEVSCVGNDDGIIEIGYEGGLYPYDVTWSNTEVTNTITDLTDDFYSVTIMDINGCEIDSTFSVGSSNENCLEIPYALTPNGDSYNDTWRIRGIELYNKITIEIFNRWGSLVYEFEGTGEQYSYTSVQFAGLSPGGSELPHGSYVFILTFIDDSTLDPISGVLSIVR